MLRPNVSAEAGPLTARPRTLGELAAYAAGALFVRGLRAVFAFLWSWRVSLVYLAAAWWLWSLGWFGALLAVALLALPLVDAHTRPYAVYLADSRRRARLRARRRALEAGNEVLRQMALVPRSDDDTVYPATWEDTPEGGVLTVEAPIPGLPPSKIGETCKAYRTQWNAARVRVSDLGDGAVRVCFISRDPLDEAHELEVPCALDTTDMSVPCGVDADGREFRLRFQNTAGMLLAGIPGSGKSAAANSFCLPLALDPNVELTVLDGKGGEDWTAYRDVCADFVSIDTDFGPALEVLEKAVAEMNHRVATNKELFGVSNFWEASPEERYDAGRKFKVIVFDECQTAFDTTGLSKEEKEVRAKITAALTSLVKKGRSAGILTLFITQKPTADAIPTAIRDNLAIRASLRLMTRDAEAAVLGEAGDDLDVPRAVEIPDTRLGGAVVASNGGRVAMRFYYMPEKRIRGLLETRAREMIALEKMWPENAL